ncbi:MAG: sodium:proton antiporter [Bacillota bacterium]|nr:sodium:proton antiporter [Bacillota bacterium]
MLPNYIGAFLLFIFGLYIILIKKNLIKLVMGIGLMDSGINLLLISIGFRLNGSVPMLITDWKDGMFFIDPLPQAFTLAAILINTCVTVLALTIVIKVKEHYGSIDADKVRRLKG